MAQAEQDREADDRCDHAGEGIRGDGHGSGNCRRGGQTGQQHDESDAEPDPAAGQGTGDRSGDEGDQGDRCQQDWLVRPAELRDGILLDGRRRGVDDHRPDRQYR